MYVLRFQRPESAATQEKPEPVSSDSLIIRLLTLQQQFRMFLNRGAYVKYMNEQFLGSHQSNPERSKLWRLREPRNASPIEMITYQESDGLFRCGP